MIKFKYVALLIFILLILFIKSEEIRENNEMISDDLKENKIKNYNIIDNPIIGVEEHKSPEFYSVDILKVQSDIDNKEENNKEIEFLIEDSSNRENIYKKVNNHIIIRKIL